MGDIPVGATGTFEMQVAPEHLASQFKDASLPPVLATPVMVMVMENAALNAIRPYLDPGQSAVGTRVDIAHLAPTPVGQRVRGEAKVSEVDGKRLAFTIRAFDEHGEIGRGTHERMTIDLAKFTARLRGAKGGA
jgi:fluoroacetyl-CoA thioesterase